MDRGRSGVEIERCWWLGYADDADEDDVPACYFSERFGVGWDECFDASGGVEGDVYLREVLQSSYAALLVLCCLPWCVSIYPQQPMMAVLLTFNYRQNLT